MHTDYQDYDVIVIGAGFSGAVLAEQLASKANFRVLVLEQREHTAGNCYDYQNEHGIRVHKYGPHLFHTDNQNVWNYLSQFTEWTPYEHEVLSRIDGQLVPLPFNLNTLDKLFDKPDAERIATLLVKEYGEGKKIPILTLRKSDHPELRQIAELVYEKFFVNYTSKQWGCSPESISPAVLARVPVVISRDNRYFQDPYQAIPKQGYHGLIEKLLDHPNITVQLNVDALAVLQVSDTNKVVINGHIFDGIVAYTGMLDALFKYSEGELPYRSLQFRFETVPTQTYQPATTVNYPNEEAFTRITEFKHIHPVETPVTTIVKEYPQDYDRFDLNKNIPYYPIFNDANQEKYNQYKVKLDAIDNLVCLGRLADYRYYDMDDAVANALAVANTLMNSTKN